MKLPSGHANALVEPAH